ncbi:hypothetical protein GCM10010329_05510 [Streptomyces spiroverticillatus]|uniref:Uncharacterized protein n=1 Tax=Streptomyces finlayi TaxID=67296 RepID=A0A918WSY6_9ACTN|nr:hypothetical protein [Streptomyces finlayi]GGZ88302.1 hypothetical protein GCM10010329_05510 [Streptomyces spiroverticillatus]GHC79339.1 hypothetical protein GCM10010334_05490 [Streptomyces finlayi]
MPGIISKLKSYARSPQGRRTIARGRQQAANPRRRSQARSLLGRLRGGGRGHGGARRY